MSQSVVICRSLPDDLYRREESRSFLSQRQPTDSSLDQKYADWLPFNVCNSTEKVVSNVTSYPQRYDSVPRNTTAPYAAGRPETDVSYNTYQDQSKLTGSQTGTEDRAGLAYDEEATSQKASGLERRRTYPSGTRSYDEKDGFIYYYDEYKRCIGKEPSRRESDPGPDPGLGDITTGLSQLGIGARDQRNREAMENYRVQSQANDSSRNRHPGRQRRLSSAQKSNLAPVREDKRPNPIYTDELDKREYYRFF